MRAALRFQFYRVAAMHTVVVFRCAAVGEGLELTAFSKLRRADHTNKILPRQGY
jgi:hypothetical protein